LNKSKNSIRIADREKTMARREILKYGHPVLAKPAEPIQEIDAEILNLAQDMVETMHTAPGIGLAAPQVNASRRLITVDLSVGERPEDLIILINPELISQEGEIVSEEGCLSVPDIQEKVTRPRKVTVRGLDIRGKDRIIQAEELLARVFCHEIDHLNGKLFIERLSPLKKALVKKTLKKRLDTGGP
jgi:peptide deformylase